MRGITESTLFTIAASPARVSTIRISAKPKAPTSAGMSDAAGEVVRAEGEAVEGVDAFLADLRGEEAEEARDPALERVVPGEAAGHHHAEQREPEELEGAELERDLAESGVKSARQNTPNSVPTTEPVVAMPIARPAWPCCASA